METKVMFLVHPKRMPKFCLQGYEASAMMFYEKGGVLLIGVDGATKKEADLFQDVIMKHYKKAAVLGIHAKSGKIEGKYFDNSKKRNVIASAGPWVLMSDSIDWVRDLVANEMLD